ncbi:MAG: hypothetical protein KatS3mg096_653 [Candidatus Parcubacteria bacterium]|nr:MAG: hypothetical protein KatS3mg096_653 [Candidatus Parcubacteria bacterium]
MSIMTKTYEKLKKCHPIYTNVPYDDSKCKEFAFAISKFKKNILESSIVGAYLKYVNLNLSLREELGELYLIPYRVRNSKEDLYIIQMTFGYKGIRKWLLQSKNIKNIIANTVCISDHIHIDFGNMTVEHSIKDYTVKRSDPDNIIGVYAIVYFTDGERYIKYLSKDDIERYRLQNPDQKKDEIRGIWANYYDYMIKGKLIKSLHNDIPLEADVLKAIQLDNAIIKDVEEVDYVNAEEVFNENESNKNNDGDKDSKNESDTKNES